MEHLFAEIEGECLRGDHPFDIAPSQLTWSWASRGTQSHRLEPQVRARFGYPRPSREVLGAPPPSSAKIETYGRDSAGVIRLAATNGFYELAAWRIADEYPENGPRLYEYRTPIRSGQAFSALTTATKELLAVSAYSYNAEGHMTGVVTAEAPGDHGRPTPSTTRERFFWQGHRLIASQYEFQPANEPHDATAVRRRLVYKYAQSGGVSVEIDQWNPTVTPKLTKTETGQRVSTWIEKVAAACAAAIRAANISEPLWCVSVGYLAYRPQELKPWLAVATSSDFAKLFKNHQRSARRVRDWPADDFSYPYLEIGDQFDEEGQQLAEELRAHPEAGLPEVQTIHALTAASLATRLTTAGHRDLLVVATDPSGSDLAVNADTIGNPNSAALLRDLRVVRGSTR